MLLGATETIISGLKIWPEGDPVGRAHSKSWIAERPTAQYPLRPASRPLCIVYRADTIISRSRPVGFPFEQIAAHVIKAQTIWGVTTLRIAISGGLGIVNLFHRAVKNADLLIFCRIEHRTLNKSLHSRATCHIPV